MALANSCIARWKFNDDLATKVVLDDIGGHNGEATYNTEDMHVAGVIDGALATGAGTPNYYIVVPHHSDFNFGADGNFSVSIWFYKQPGANGALFVKYDDELTKGWYINVIGDYVWAAISDGVNEISVQSTITVIPNIWYLLKVNFDRDGVITIYIDNVQCGQSESIAGVGDVDTDSDICLGAWNGGAVPLAGYMDCTLLCNDLLTASDRNFLRNCGLGTEGALPPFLIASNV